ncbi:methionine--tRNA ligase [Candidatus Saccharibacteria bacterium]|nr:methionine--tRNA ligase [Candidatus Saccharibacteria bacterium]
MKRAYITTAIPYVNAKPHVGHALDYLLADVLRRYLSMCDYEVRFQAGSDEHGSKIYQKALAQKLSTQEFVDQNAAKLKAFIQSLGVEYTDFIRTTDAAHERRCQEIWRRLSKHIYKDSYTSWYCNGCESFVTDKEYADNHGICPDHQAEYVRLSEENYFLRISDFKEQICRVVESDQVKIIPAFRKKEVLNLLADMPDVSISRPRTQVPWGITVPDDDTQVMYVWLDALTNYITVLGYPDHDISDYWPAHTQIIGKDILRFHVGIWLSILIGLDLPLPRRILAHGFITVDGQKMSKSIGNVVDPLDILSRHGLEAFRYYFLRHISSFDDSDFSWEKYDAAYNELANDLGNLVQRLATLCRKNHLSGLRTPSISLDTSFVQKMEACAFHEAFTLIWGEIQQLNRRIDAEKPWTLAKTDPAAAQRCLESLVSDLLRTNQSLAIFLPDTAQAIDATFTAQSITPPETPLFPKNPAPRHN